VDRKSGLPDDRRIQLAGPDFTHDVQGGADHQSWDAVRLDNVAYETDGLVTKGSVGHEQGEIHRKLF
jgi:hypothetical protein